MQVFCSFSRFSVWLLKEPLGNKTEDLSLLGSCSLGFCSLGLAALRLCCLGFWQSWSFGALGCFPWAPLASSPSWCSSSPFLGLLALRTSWGSSRLLSFLSFPSLFLGSSSSSSGCGGFLVFLGDFLAAGLFAAALLGFLAAAGFLL